MIFLTGVRIAFCLHLDTINNIRKKFYTKLEDEFAFDFKYNNDIIDSRRLTNLIINFIDLVITCQWKISTPYSIP